VENFHWCCSLITNYNVPYVFFHLIEIRYIRLFTMKNSRMVFLAYILDTTCWRNFFAVLWKAFGEFWQYGWCALHSFAMRSMSWISQKCNGSFDSAAFLIGCSRSIIWCDVVHIGHIFCFYVVFDIYRIFCINLWISHDFARVLDLKVFLIFYVRVQVFLGIFYHLGRG